jgi:hypothetical protein
MRGRNATCARRAINPARAGPAVLHALRSITILQILHLLSILRKLILHREVSAVSALWATSRTSTEVVAIGVGWATTVMEAHVYAVILATNLRMTEVVATVVQ